MAGAVVTPKSANIVIAPGNVITASRKAWTRPGGHVAFVITNEDNYSHVVRIPIDEFVPDPPNGLQPGPPDPMQPLSIHWATVAANDVAVIQLQVRPHGHFPNGNWTYKYTIYSADDVFGTNENELDPQIEINN